MTARIRAWAAVALARLAAALSRAAGHGGSSFPGAVARRIDPGLLTRLAAGLTGGALLITGTNGKTTSALLVEGILAADGRRVVRNRSGANLILGLTTTLMANLTWAMKPRALWAVLETDEATVPRAVAEVRPGLVAVTNFFRDQLDRYGELSTTVELVAGGLSMLGPQSVTVLNADDPHAVGLAGEAPGRVLFFGLSREFPAGADLGEATDARFCPRCGHELTYRRRFYAHLGHFRCRGCGFSRPDAEVEVVGRQPKERDGALTVRVGGRTLRAAFSLPGTYNAYNAALAVAVATALGASDASIRTGLEESRGAFGRMEAVALEGRELRLALVKNPTGFNQVLRALTEDPRPKTVVAAINDRYADGRDVSWLWDVDFETLAPLVGAVRWIAAGVRARDMAVRLKYAGVPGDRIETVGPGGEDALRAILAVVGDRGPEPVYVLPTYTAMMELRAALERRGLVKSFVNG